MRAGTDRGVSRGSDVFGWVLLGTGVVVLSALLLLLRLGLVTDYLCHALVKDPPRTAPPGRVIVAPADGTVLYVRHVRDGMLPAVVKQGTAVAIEDHLKTEPFPPFEAGYLIGIYMNTQGVHVNRMPDHGTIRRQVIYNGPHMGMSEAEKRIILTQMIPGLVTLRKLVGLPPYDIEDAADYALQSARETLLVEDDRGSRLYVVRIADYYVGKILTWVKEGQWVERGERIGMITWGSQTDLFIENTPGLEISVAVGDYVYGGETVLAKY